MISDEYFHISPEEEYEPLTESCFFVGMKIRNRYDELRIKINNLFKPGRYYIKEKDNKFYGTKLNIPFKYKALFKEISARKPFDYIGYSHLLQNYGLSSNESIHKLSNFMYPVDYNFIKDISPDFDYSSYLCLNDGSANFQRFAQPELYIISFD